QGHQLSSDPIGLLIQSSTLRRHCLQPGLSIPHPLLYWRKLEDVSLKATLLIL
mgnify:CR=1